MDLTDEQWAAIEHFFPAEELNRTTPKGGRPFRPVRDVLNGVMWVLSTGAPWADLPPRYPPYQTCHRRFQAWSQTGVLQNVLKALAEDLRARGKLDLTEAYIDGRRENRGRDERSVSPRHRQQARTGESHTQVAQQEPRAALHVTSRLVDLENRRDQPAPSLRLGH